ncbi:helix-turn-helix domain-containing protein [Solirubrobacter sp. CPCC 204708]|uniref:Helix-turn-helix domain-containing protein n=1 Tax=Solirubrobacter deserti TaxID=2282478 RepID=A0ABT4RI96_9ACTN|nr:helix-turn-helix domain-containing protein [Solirubrobacter deserti]MBE2318893.1 helix-turn-helix domain-containing protein [Solirubrobacter deserti]MDA0138274.1 helix-turn-helix domain-containing protein [Solirubrobacter deserti]
MDIAEVTASTGLPPSTLRYYEQRGLIESTGRSGLRRQFDPSVLQRLSLIALWRHAGFSLDEIAGMFGPDGEPRIDRAQLAAKADELDARIRELSALRDGLRHAAACSAPSHLECPTFQRALAAQRLP